MYKLSSRIQSIMPFIFMLSLAVATFLLLMEVSPSESKFPHADKVIHIILFLGLSLFGMLAYPKYPIQILVGLALYGALMEILQHLITVTRFASLLDWIADIIGIVLCLLAMRLLKQPTT